MIDHKTYNDLMNIIIKGIAIFTYFKIQLRSKESRGTNSCIASSLRLTIISLLRVKCPRKGLILHLKDSDRYNSLRGNQITRIRQELSIRIKQPMLPSSIRRIQIVSIILRFYRKLMREGILNRARHHKRRIKFSLQLILLLHRK